MPAPLKQLEDELAARPGQALVVAGVGVSLATCDNQENASWRGLLRNGLDECRHVGVTKSRVRPYFEILEADESKARDLVNVATFVTDELRSAREGAYARWLENAVGGIRVVDPRLVQALAALKVKLATTNYDHMVEEGCQGSAVTWRQKARCSQFWRENPTDVLHLHGSYRDPESIVLGARSYADVCNDDFLR